MALDPTVTVRELTDADDITDAVVDAFARLIPQLSSSSPAPSRDELIAMATADAKFDCLRAAFTSATPTQVCIEPYVLD